MKKLLGNHIRDLNRTNKNRVERKRSMMVNIVIILGILIVINLISVNMFARLDLSRGRIYSLSRSSKEAVRELPDRLLIKAFFTKNLPPQLADAHRYTRDILSEYQAYSRGRIRFEFVDPGDEDHLRQEAQRHQVTPVSMRVIEDDKLEIREIFMGLVFFYRGKTETIPFIQNTRGLEYDITSNIKKITDIGRKSVGLFKVDELPPAVPGRQQPQTRYSTVSEMISNHYSLQTMDLMEPVPPGVNTLIIGGVKDSLHIEQLYNFDQFLMRGGRALIFQEKIAADLQSLTAQPIKSNLFDLLEHYGIRMKENLVTDANAGQIQVQRQQGIFSFATPVNYPPFPVVNNLNREHLITKNLENLQLVFASELDVNPAGNAVNFISLLKTSDNSGEIRGPSFDISFERYMQQRDLRRILTAPAKVVGGIYEGYFESYYLDMFPDEDDPLAEDFYYRTNDAKIILVADSEFIKDGGGAGVKANLDFVLNSIDYLMDETTLIEIRARETVFRPLREISSSARKFVRWTNILLPSFFLLIFGAFNYHKQLQRRKLIRKIYEQE